MAPTTTPQHTPVPQGTKTQVWPEYSSYFSRNSDGTGGNLNRIGGLEAVIPRNNTAGSSPKADPLGMYALALYHGTQSERQLGALSHT